MITETHMRISCKGKLTGMIILQTAVAREKAVQANDVHRECTKLRGHLVGDESIFTFPRRVKVLCRLS